MLTQLCFSADVLAMVGRSLTYATAALVLGLAATSASGAPARHITLRRCPQLGHGRILKRDSQAVVYLVPSHFVFVPGQETRLVPTEIAACARRTRLLAVLGPPASFGSQGGGGVERVRLAGTMVAYESIVTGKETTLGPTGTLSETLTIRDLLDGAVVHKLNKARIESLVLKSDGSVAWGVGEVIKALERTGERVLAFGPSVEVASLKLRGSTLSWTEGGQLHTATLH